MGKPIIIESLNGQSIDTAFDTNAVLLRLLDTHSDVDVFTDPEAFFTFFVQRVLQNQQVVIPLPNGGIVAVAVQDLLSNDFRMVQNKDEHCSAFACLKLEFQKCFVGGSYGMSSMSLQVGSHETMRFYQELNTWLTAIVFEYIRLMWAS